MSNPFDRLGSLISPELLSTLTECYPHRCPDPNLTEREIWMKAGERRLVDVLLAKFNETQEDSLMASPLHPPQ